MFFEKLFSFIRHGVKNAVLGGIEDANTEIQSRLDFHEEPITIEDKPKSRLPNGKAKSVR